MSLVIVIAVVVIVLAYAIYKVSRENRASSAPLEMPTPQVQTGPPDAASVNEPQHLHLFELIRNMLTDAAHGGEFTTRHSDSMIPMTTIEAGVAHFTASYRGKNRDQMISIIDDSLTDLKSRFGNEVSVRDLREFVMSQRQKLFPHDI
jgi:hypothetical protein